MEKNLSAIILAAGKGTRMKSKKVNKVALNLAQKPMILHTVELLEGLKIKNIIVVVGFAKKSIVDLLKDRVKFVEQKKRLGTAHAALQGLKSIPKGVRYVFVLNGDDSAFYTKKILLNLLSEHKKNKNAITFLTINVKNPFGLGRIIRNNKGKVIAIFEEKDASLKQRKISEINPGCYLFNVDFLQRNLSKTPKSKVTGEYYIVSLIAMAISKNEKVEGIRGGNIPWRGVNTKDELQEAEALLKGIKK